MLSRRRHGNQEPNQKRRRYLQRSTALQKDIGTRLRERSNELLPELQDTSCSIGQKCVKWTCEALSSSRIHSQGTFHHLSKHGVRAHNTAKGGILGLRQPRWSFNMCITLRAGACCLLQECNPFQSPTVLTEAEKNRNEQGTRLISFSPNPS